MSDDKHFIQNLAEKCYHSPGLLRFAAHNEFSTDLKNRLKIFAATLEGSWKESLEVDDVNGNQN